MKQKTCDCCKHCTPIENHAPFTVFGKGKPPHVKWHVRGPGVDTSKHYEGWDNSADAGDHAKNCKKHH